MLPQRQRGGALYSDCLHTDISDMDDKSTIRQQALASRRKLSPIARQQASNTIEQHFITRFSNTAAIWLVYRALADEVETRALFAQNDKRIFAPVTHARDRLEWHEIGADTIWQQGDLGVEEPQNGKLWAPDSGKALLVCPVVGFDRNGNRLGLGLGCFDRWLARFHHHLHCTVGLAFACQEIETIPHEVHDIALDYVITERGVITCRMS